MTPVNKYNLRRSGTVSEINKLVRKTWTVAVDPVAIYQRHLAMILHQVPPPHAQYTRKRCCPWDSTVFQWVLDRGLASLQSLAWKGLESGMLPQCCNLRSLPFSAGLRMFQFLRASNPHLTPVWPNEIICLHKADAVGYSAGCIYYLHIPNPRMLNPTLTCMRERDVVAEKRSARAGLLINSFPVWTRAEYFLEQSALHTLLKGSLKNSEIRASLIKYL